VSLLQSVSRVVGAVSVVCCCSWCPVSLLQSASLCCVVVAVGVVSRVVVAVCVCVLCCVVVGVGVRVLCCSCTQCLCIVL